MGKLLEILGVKNQENLDKDILFSEELIIGMQEIYKNAPDGYKKDKLANAIAEMVRLMMQQIKGMPVQTTETTVQVEPPTVTDTVTDLVQGKWYISNYAGVSGDRLYTVIQFYDKVISLDVDIISYSNYFVAYKDGSGKLMFSAYRRGETIANNDLSTMFREATNDDIEKAILDYINVNRLYPIGSYVTNTNIGGNYTDIQITRPIYAMREIIDKIVFYVDNFKVYDSNRYR